MSNVKFNSIADDISVLSSVFGGNAKGEAVIKSLTTGNDVAVPGTTGGAALRRQELREDVKNLTFGRADFTIFNMIPRSTTTESTLEYNIQDGYGDTGSRGYVREMDIAAVNDLSLERKLVRMKIVSDTRQVSLQSLQVGNVANPLDLSLEAAIISVSKDIEYGIFYGDADLTGIGGAGQGTEFDGLEKLIPEQNVLDLRGDVLTEQQMNQAGVIVGRAFGTPTDAFMDLGVHANFVQNQLSRQWVTQGSAQNVATGFNVPQMVTTRGVINLHSSTIMNSDKLLNPQDGVSVQSPVAPTVTAAIDKGAGNFLASDLKAPAKYAVRLVSEKGSKSVPTYVDATVDDIADEVTLSIVLGAQLLGSPRHVEVYRLDAATNQYWLISRIPFFKATAAAGVYSITFVDKNEIIPGTSEVFVGELQQRSIELLELYPMYRLPLATVNAAAQFAVMWSGALALYAPKRWVRIINVKSQL